MPSILENIGFYTVMSSPRDIHIILVLRCIRLAAFGAISLLLVHFLKAKDIGETQIGVLLTLTLAGDLIFSFLLALVSDALGRRKILLLAAFLMTLTGCSLYYFTNVYVIAFVMIFGIITPTGMEVGPFRSIEQSAISTLVRYENRSDIFSWYTFAGGFSSGCGAYLVGYLVKQNNYGVCFIFYTGCSLLLLFLSFFLSESIELQNDIEIKEEQLPIEADDDTDDQQERLLGSASIDGLEQIEPIITEPKEPIFKRLIPKLSPASLNVLLWLTFFICLDSLGISLSSKAWTAYYFSYKFNLSSSTLGAVFGIASIVGAFMALFGTYFCKKYGPIRTMLTSHPLASVLLTLLSLPIGLRTTILLFLVMSSARTMDLPSKHVFISAVVQPQERTAAISFINASKTLVQTFGPTISGVLASHKIMWLCFLLSGGLRLSYDVGIFWKFWHLRDQK